MGRFVFRMMFINFLDQKKSCNLREAGFSFDFIHIERDVNTGEHLDGLNRCN